MDDSLAAEVDWDALLLEPCCPPRVGADECPLIKFDIFKTKVEPDEGCMASPVLSDLSDSTWCRQEKRVQVWPASAGASPTEAVGAFRSDSMDSSGGVMVMIDDAAAGSAAAQHAAAVPPPAQPHVTHFKPQHASLAGCCGPACAGGCCVSCQAGAWSGGDGGVANVPPKHSTLRTAQAAARQSSGQRGGGSASGRGSCAGPSVRAMRLVHKRETNRAAQQRWRDRRKSKVSQERELRAALETAVLEKQLQQTQLATNVLRSRITLLEQQTATAAAVPEQQAVAAALAEARAAPLLAREQLAMQLAGGGAEGQPAAWWLNAVAQDRLAAELGLPRELVISVRPGPPLTTNLAQLAAAPKQELAALWREYTEAMAACLCLLRSGVDGSAAEGAVGAEAAARGDSSTASRLAQLVFEYINLKIAVLVAFPNMTPAAEPHAADAVAKAAAAARSSSVDDFWWQVIDGAGLKPEQKAAIIGLRDDHLSHVCTLAAGRRALEASLQQTAAPLLVPLDGASTAADAAENFTFVPGGLADVINSIRESLIQQHSAFLRTVHSVWAGVLTPAQFATMNICAFDAHPSAFLCAEALAIAAGRPTTAALERQLVMKAQQGSAAVTPVPGSCLASTSTPAAAGSETPGVHMPPARTGSRAPAGTRRPPRRAKFADAKVKRSARPMAVIMSAAAA